MVIQTRNQQTKLGKPTKMKLSLILQGVAQFFIKFHASIEKFNNAASNNSMRTTGMEFFVPVLALVNAPKQDQVSAWFEAEFILHVFPNLVTR